MTRAKPGSAKGSICVLLALTLAWFGLGSAEANEPPQGEVRITSLTPDVINPEDPEGEIHIEGEFTNTTGVPLTWATAELWHYSAQLSSFASVDVALRTPAEAPLGTRHEPGTPLAEEEPIPPGATVGFELDVPSEAVRATTPEIATLLGVHIRAVPEGTEQRSTVGRVRALLPHAAQPFDVVQPAIITARPGQLPGSQSVNDALGDAITGEHLTALTAAVEDGEKVLLDPSVYQAAVTLAGTESTEAQEFVTTVHRAHALGLLWWLPPGNPALERMPPELRSEVPGWARDALPESLADAPLVALTGDPQAVPDGFDHTLTFGGGDESSYLFRLGGGETVIGDVTEPVSTASLPSGAASWPDLDEEIATFQDRARIRFDLNAAALGEVEDAQQGHILIMQSYGAGFREEADALAYLHSSPLATFDPAEISMSVAQSFVMGSRTNEFPTTISNQSSLDVRVRILMRSENPQRITVPDTDVVTVMAGESQTLLLAPQATANGVTTVHAQLASADGALLGPSQSVEVTSTEFGRVGWILIIVSGAVVLGGTVWRIRTVRHERAKEASEPGQ